MKKVDIDILKRTAENFFSLKELEEKLKKNRQLIIKYGVDVTAPFLHIGHAVNLWMMRYLQTCGHKVVFLIGDFTTRIGDPTGKSKTRQVIPEDVIEKNSKEFIKQVGKVLIEDKEVFEVRHNADWFDKMSLNKFLSLCSMVTYSKLIQRDMFQRRIKEKKEIHLHEMVYPLLQGYDSYVLKSDITIVGNDQLFNELMGRFYQEKLGQEPQVIITTKITPGTDGKEKQSKSLGNYIALEDTPRDKYGKIMSLPDNLIIPYLEVYTEIPMEEIKKMEKEIESGGVNPMVVKHKLAQSVVERYHGAKIKEEESVWFKETFSKRNVPEDIEKVNFDNKLGILDNLKKCMPNVSKSELRRLVVAGGVRLNGEKIKLEDSLNFKNGDIIKIGKRNWFKVYVS